MEIKVPFLKQPVGLGDAAKALTNAVGVKKPCGGCQKRAAALNNAVTLVPADRSSLGPARVGKFYKKPLGALVLGGAIPPGLAVDPQTKVLSGIPTAAGKYELLTTVGTIAVEVIG